MVYFGMDQTTERENLNFLKSIRQVIPRHCEHCGFKYTTDNLKILKRTPQTTLLHLQCSSCRNAYMINVVSPSNTVQGSSRVPINIDISQSSELEKFAGHNPVSSEHVLRTHDLMKAISTADDFKKLLS